MTAHAEKHHPAQYSREILAAIKPIIECWQLPVHDPFAGPGLRLAQLCDELGLPFTGTEIEREFIVDCRVLADDSTRAYTYPINDHVIVTSPSYPNGMADHFHARDDSERHTYRQAIANIRGSDRELSENNMGRYSARAGMKAFNLHMEIAGKAVEHWPDRVIVNVSDFIAGGEVFEYVASWWDLLRIWGYEITQNIEVATPRQRHGANGGARVDHEVVLVAIR